MDKKPNPAKGAAKPGAKPAPTGKAAAPKGAGPKKK